MMESICATDGWDAHNSSLNWLYPRLLDVLSVHVHLFDQTMELCVSEGFCQPVRNHLRHWNILEVDASRRHFVADVVVLDVNVLCLSMVDWVVGKSDRSLVVAFERDQVWGSDEVYQGVVRDQVMSFLLLVSKVGLDFGCPGTPFSNFDFGTDWWDGAGPAPSTRVSAM